MIFNNVILTVKDAANIPPVADLLATLASRSRQEPGCHRFEVYQSQADSATFFLIEQWQDQAALDAHRQAPAFAELYVPEVIPLIERTPHLCDLLSP